MFKDFINRRLAAAAEEIFEPFKKTMAEDEDQIQSHRADVQPLCVSIGEIPPELQERSPSLDQEDPPKPPIIKEEQEELWSSQEGEQLRRLGEADNTSLIFTPVPMKSEKEDDGGKPESLQLHEKHTEEKGNAEKFKTEQNFSPDSHLVPVSDEEVSYCESETDDSCDWEETKEPQPGLNALRNQEMFVCEGELNAGEISVSSSECVTNFDQKEHQLKYKGIQTGEKPFNCSVCGKRFGNKSNLSAHMMRHTKEKGFDCSVCKKSFPKRGELVRHMRIHTGEKPFSCSVCGKSFTQKPNLYSHQQVHATEKPYSCSVCGKSFTQKSSLNSHQQVHTGEKPYSCSVCGKRFAHDVLRKHMRTHTGEKPYSCSVCGKQFMQFGNVKRHLIVHTGEKPFSCSICDKKFTQLGSLNRHKCKGTSLS